MGGAMRLSKSFVRAVLLEAFALSFGLISVAQEKPRATSPTTSSRSPKVEAKKAQATSSPEADAEGTATGEMEDERKDSAEQIRKREEWFYKQRSSVKGHIPAGVRLKAFQHTQRMMLAEGKLVQRADGSYEEVVPLA